jgi:hypothetical protein
MSEKPPFFNGLLGIICTIMKYTIPILGLSLFLTACSSYDAQLGRQIAGTWTRPMSGSSPTEPAVFTRTISSDGNFTTSIGRRSALVTYQGTWQVRDGELVMTVTNAQGMGQHRAGSPVGSIDRIKIIHVDDHQWIYESEGHTNILTRS